MKLSQSTALGFTTLLAVAIAISSFGSRATADLTASSTTANSIVAQNQQVAVMSGTFVAAEKPTTGTARIVRENGHHYLELDSAFGASDQGPDLHVLLDSAAKPPMSYDQQNMGSYVNLGKLEKFQGTQRYPIPDSIDPSNYKSVSIWCRMANATFGYAPLSTSSTASTK